MKTEDKESKPKPSDERELTDEQKRAEQARIDAMRPHRPGDWT